MSPVEAKFVMQCHLRKPGVARQPGELAGREAERVEGRVCGEPRAYQVRLAEVAESAEGGAQHGVGGHAYDNTMPEDLF